MQFDPRQLGADDDVLIVDDDMQNLKFLSDVLRSAGLHVRPASDGELALRTAMAKPPALIVLDIRMPGLDGFEVCRRLKASAATRDIPVIFASGLGDTAEKIKGFEMGAVDYVTKPLNAQEVLMRVSTHLALFASRRRLEVQNRQLKEAELAANQAKEYAEAANRAKSAFLANMSHELRTPLTGILGMTELALRRSEDPKVKDHLGKALQSSTHLLNLINDILDISKIEAERLSLERIRFRLGEPIENLANLIGPSATEKGLKFFIDLPPGLIRQYVLGDPTRLHQILFNLVGNAVKFTPQGSVTLRCRAVDEASTSGVLRWEVVDTGIGIAPDDQKKLFTTFGQVDVSMSRKYGGTGLGLAISRRLVGMMKGEIGVVSEPGKGSTFWFTTKLEPAPDTGATAMPKNALSTAEAALREEYAGARVLLAEDDPVNQEVSQGLLDLAGLAVDVAADGKQALAFAQNTRYDLILMDVQMPMLDGLEAARAIRAGSLNVDTPMLAMTANAFDEDRQACIDAGMDDHIGKPVQPDLLYTTLLHWLSQRSSGAHNAAK